MKRKNISLVILLFALSVVLVACGDKDTDATNDDTKEVEQEDVAETDDDLEQEEATEEEVEVEAVTDGEIFNPAIAEETEGDVELIYTNENADYENDIDGFIIKADAYQIVKVTDMNESQRSRFDDNTEGYVVTTKASIENKTDIPIQYSVYMNIQMDDKFDYISSDTKYYIPEEHQLSWDDSDEIGVYKSGEKREFWLTTRITNEEFDKLENIEPKFVIEGRLMDAEADEGAFGDDAVFDFVMSDEQAETVANSPDFYQDKLTTDNIAKKEMIFEQSDINETEELDGYSITVEGVQYTNITPNESSEERFRNFDGDDLVAVTIHITQDNQSDETIANSSLSAWLSVNNDEARIQNAGMVENSSPSEVGPGDTGENYIVFLMKEKYYDIYETFELEIGPFLGDDGYAFKEKKMNFDLPSE